MTILTRNQANISNNFEMIEVDVSEWGEINLETGKPDKTTVFVREMSAHEKDAFEASLFETRRGKTKMKLDDVRARMAVLVCCDENRKPIFQPGDEAWLSTKGVRPLSKIYNAARELNDISDEDEEELIKN